MGIYILNGYTCNTDNAVATWPEAREFDGRNRISLATGSQWDHEQLYKSRRGFYYIVEWSQWQGTHARARVVSEEEAAAWLLQQTWEVDELPEELRAIGKKLEG
jgi:hypothetical protein